MFIEVTDRRNAAYTIVLNQDFIIKVSDDGVGAVITYRGTVGGSTVASVEILKVTETYAAVKTALGL